LNSGSFKKPENKIGMMAFFLRVGLYTNQTKNKLESRFNKYPLLNIFGNMYLKNQKHAVKGKRKGKKNRQHNPGSAELSHHNEIYDGLHPKGERQAQQTGKKGIPVNKSDFFTVNFK
jgi:hypothetical protein